MKHFIVDVEADGPAPGLSSMVSFAVVELAATGPGRSFEGFLKPIVEHYVPSALASCNLTREQTLAFPEAQETMQQFHAWLSEVGGPGRKCFISDNPGFDFGFVNYYCWAFLGENPFGHSARRIGDLAAGLERKFAAPQKWKKLRRTPHTHRALDDARGNAEALVALLQQHKLDIPFK